jgi:hypothetical protein
MSLNHPGQFDVGHLQQLDQAAALGSLFPTKVRR